jgi:hypothetical protein
MGALDAQAQTAHDPRWPRKKETDEMRPERDAKTGRFLVGHSSVGHRFLPGNSGLPGRPKGARNKLAEAMIDDLYQDWKAHGIQAIRECRETRPADYLKIVAMIVSKAEDLSGLADGMHDAAMEQFIAERRQQALAMIAKKREPQ